MRRIARKQDRTKGHKNNEPENNKKRYTERKIKKKRERERERKKGKRKAGARQRDQSTNKERKN